MTFGVRALSIIVGCYVASVSVLRGADRPGVVHQSFDGDPKWEGRRNRLVPDPPPVTRQHFGWSDTNHAGGKGKGEIGGRVQRSATMATYAMPIKPVTLNDKLHASGRFAVTQDDGTSGVLFGWFNQTSRGWRTPNSFGFRLDGNGGGGYWLFFEYGTKNYLTGGGGAMEGRYQVTKTKPFMPDGTQHVWTLEYDPDGAGGNGVMRMTIDGVLWEEALKQGHKQDGATFDRFGIWNVQTTGGGMDVWYDDLEVNGDHFTFDADPKWEGKGNDVEFPDRVRRPLQDFGFTPTNFAGGKGAGELGGVIWRDYKAAWYADRVGRLSLDDELRASGTIAFTRQGSDSAVWLGWFDSASKPDRAGAKAPQIDKNLLGIVIEGPSRIGHYFRQGYRTNDGGGLIADHGPVIRPDGKPHRWTMHYRPTGGANNAGVIDVTLDDEKVTLDLRPEDRKRGAAFDRFGLFNVQEGGHYVEVFLDDLTYTSAAAAAAK
jgi:hypothetical protein